MNKFDVAGVSVHAVNMESACDVVAKCLLTPGASGYVCVTGAHGIVEAQRNPDVCAALNGAVLNVPDGTPLVWLGRAIGFKEMGRVYGPDLMLELCRRSVENGWTHFFYGGKAGLAEELRACLEKRFPGLRTVGTFCPPFRALNKEEAEQLEVLVDQVRPDFFWIGLSTPKQELFMWEYLPRLKTRIMLGVGAAFDINSGRSKDAPQWIKKAGLQWFYRLVREPRRLWSRYAVVVPWFAWIAMGTILRERGRGNA